MVGSSCAAGQLVELIEFVPAAAVSPGARVSAPALTPGALDVDGVDVCDPGCPVSVHVASTPEKVIAQVPEPDPDPDPDPDPAPEPFVHTLAVAVTTHV